MDNPLVQPDPGLFIWTIATFLVLLFLLLWLEEIITLQYI